MKRHSSNNCRSKCHQIKQADHEGLYMLPNPSVRKWWWQAVLANLLLVLGQRRIIWQSSGASPQPVKFFRRSIVSAFIQQQWIGIEQRGGELVGRFKTTQIGEPIQIQEREYRACPVTDLSLSPTEHGQPPQARKMQTRRGPAMDARARSVGRCCSCPVSSSNPSRPRAHPSVVLVPPRMTVVISRHSARQRPRRLTGPWRPSARLP